MNSCSYVEKGLAQYFKGSQILVEWSPDNTVGELIVDTSSGYFKLRTQGFEQLEAWKGIHQVNYTLRNINFFQ